MREWVKELQYKQEITSTRLYFDLMIGNEFSDLVQNIDEFVDFYMISFGSQPIHNTFFLSMFILSV